ncbi:MAG TPA: hypothetical protein VK939_03720 [Longimicrobiales bacterium]|nr:hypothetical protein [Longimicrobiales bacterium]
MPAVVDPNAARALSFLSGGTEYYQALLRAAAALDAAEERAVSRTTARFREELERWVAAQPAGWSASEHATHALRDRWAGLWAELEGVVRADTWDRLAKFAPAHSTEAAPAAVSPVDRAAAPPRHSRRATPRAQP